MQTRKELDLCKLLTIGLYSMLGNYIIVQYRYLFYHCFTVSDMHNSGEIWKIWLDSDRLGYLAWNMMEGNLLQANFPVFIPVN